MPNTLILTKIDSTNYSTPKLLYRPQVGHSGFVTSLTLTINLKSINSANFPSIPDGTPADVLEQIFQNLEETLQFKKLNILLRKDSEPWVQKADIKIFNKEPYYDVDLMPYYTKANTIDVAEELSLGIELALGDTLAADIDKITIFGTAIEEKKNNGNEELAARIEALELALYGRFTDLSPNTLLGRNVGTGTVELIAQSNFLAASNNLSDLQNKQTARNNLAGAVTNNRFLGGNGSDIILKQVDLATPDVTGILRLANGGSGIETAYTFRAAAGTAQSIPNATFTKINFLSELNDSNNQYNPTLSRLTALTTETWRIVVFLTFNLSNAGRVLVSVYKNGSEVPAQSRILDIPSNAGILALSIPILEFPLLTNDYLEVFAYCAPAASTFGDATLSSVFWYGKRIA
jgi:hypothetical protein